MEAPETAMEPRLSPQEVADIWGVDYQTINRLLKTGRLKGFKVGSKWRISREAMLAYEEENRRKVAAPPPAARRRIVTRIY